MFCFWCWYSWQCWAVCLNRRYLHGITLQMKWITFLIFFYILIFLRGDRGGRAHPNFVLAGFTRNTLRVSYYWGGRNFPRHIYQFDNLKESYVTAACVSVTTHRYDEQSLTPPSHAHWLLLLIWFSLIFWVSHNKQSNSNYPLYQLFADYPSYILTFH